MMTIENISVQDYFTMEDSTSYDVFIDVMNPNNSFNNKSAEIEAMTYDEVKTVIRILKSGVTPTTLDSIYSIVYKTRLSNGKVFDLFSSKNFIVSTFEEIIKREDRLLNFPGSDDSKWIAAGVNDLAKFSDLALKVEVAEMFGLDPETVGTWKYTKVLSILAYKRLKEHVNRNYQTSK